MHRIQIQLFSTSDHGSTYISLFLTWLPVRLVFFLQVSVYTYFLNNQYKQKAVI